MNSETLLSRRSNYMVVHVCTQRSRRKLRIALKAEKIAKEAHQKADQARKDFLEARKEAFKSIEQEYPRITDPMHPSKILARKGLVVIENPH